MHALIAGALQALSQGQETQGELGRGYLPEYGFWTPGAQVTVAGAGAFVLALAIYGICLCRRRNHTHATATAVHRLEEREPQVVSTLRQSLLAETGATPSGNFRNPAVSSPV